MPDFGDLRLFSSTGGLSRTHRSIMMWNVVVSAGAYYYLVTVTSSNILLWRPHLLSLLDVVFAVLFLLDTFLETKLTLQDYRELRTGDRAGRGRVLFLLRAAATLAGDYASAMPLGIIGQFVYGGEVPRGLRTLRLGKLVKVVLWVAIEVDLDEDLVAPEAMEFHYKMMPRVKLVFLGLLVVYTCTLGNLLLQVHVTSDTQHHTDSPDSDPFFTVVDSGYYVLYSLAGVGYGEVLQSSTKQFFSSILCLLAVLVNGVVVSYVTGALGADTIAGRQTDKLTETLAVLQEYSIPRTLANEVISFQYHRVTYQADPAELEVLSGLPVDMQVNLAHYVKIRLLSGIGLFQDADHRSLSDLAKMLTSKVYAPGQPIVKSGTIADELYFLCHGFADVLDQDMGYITTLQRGAYFGETALILKTRRTATVVSLTYCDCYALGGPDFEDILDRRSDLQSELLGKVRDILKTFSDVQKTNVIPGAAQATNNDRRDLVDVLDRFCPNRDFLLDPELVNVSSHQEGGSGMKYCRSLAAFKNMASNAPLNHSFACAGRGNGPDAGVSSGPRHTPDGKGVISIRENPTLYSPRYFERHGLHGPAGDCVEDFGSSQDSTYSSVLAQSLLMFGDPRSSGPHQKHPGMHPRNGSHTDTVNRSSTNSIHTAGSAPAPMQGTWARPTSGGSPAIPPVPPLPPPGHLQRLDFNPAAPLAQAVPLSPPPPPPHHPDAERAAPHPRMGTADTSGRASLALPDAGLERAVSLDSSDAMDGAGSACPSPTWRAVGQAHLTQAHSGSSGAGTASTGQVYANPDESEPCCGFFTPDPVLHDKSSSDESLGSASHRGAVVGRLQGSVNSAAENSLAEWTVRDTAQQRPPRHRKAAAGRGYDDTDWGSESSHSTVGGLMGRRDLSASAAQMSRSARGRTRMGSSADVLSEAGRGIWGTPRGHRAPRKRSISAESEYDPFLDLASLDCTRAAEDAFDREEFRSTLREFFTGAARLSARLLKLNARISAQVSRRARQLKKEAHRLAHSERSAPADPVGVGAAGPSPREAVARLLIPPGSPVGRVVLPPTETPRPDMEEVLQIPELEEEEVPEVASPAVPAIVISSLKQAPSSGSEASDSTHTSAGTTDLH